MNDNKKINEFSLGVSSEWELNGWVDSIHHSLVSTLVDELELCGVGDGMRDGNGWEWDGSKLEGWKEEILQTGKLKNKKTIRKKLRNLQ